MTNGIGWAVKQMQDGQRVRRAGWNGKGMWLMLISADQWSLNDPAPVPHDRFLPWIGMRTADYAFVPWLCSQTDLLACDWEIAE